MNKNTKFASYERSSDETIKNEYNIISNEINYKDIFDALDCIAVILDKNRQIIYSNKTFLNNFGFENIDDFIGKRPGEVINCIHSTKEKYGCGTSEYCRFCGAIQAILECQNKKEKIIKECRIISFKDKITIYFDLKITANMINIKNNDFIVLTLADISQEKRKYSLERIFFHDVINLAGSINGLIKIVNKLSDVNQKKNLLKMLENSSDSLLEEIDSYKQIVLAETNDLEVKIVDINLYEFIHYCVKTISYNSIAKNKNIKIDLEDESIIFFSDKVILSRIILNMLKNALEATSLYEKIIIGAKKIENRLKIWVKNFSIINQDAQYQIFQRSFSTKGKNRGLGTYSMKLLGEKYLKAEVGFISNDEMKTIFYINLPINNK